MNHPGLPRTPVTSTFNAPTGEKLKIFLYCISKAGTVNIVFFCLSIILPFVFLVIMFLLNGWLHLLALLLIILGMGVVNFFVLRDNVQIKDGESSQHILISNVAGSIFLFSSLFVYIIITKR